MRLKSTLKSIFFLCFLFGFTSAFGQFNGKHTYIAKLKEEVGIVDIKVNEYVLFSIQPDEEFIYDSFGKTAWMQNGKFGKLSEEMIERIPNSNYFKFDHSLDFFKVYEKSELLSACKAKGIDYQTMLNNSITGDLDQLEQMFLLMNVLKGTAGELHKAMMWKVFNKFEDETFANFMEEQPEDTQISISKFLVRPATLWPIEDEASYFNEYYPETYSIVKQYKE